MIFQPKNLFWLSLVLFAEVSLSTTLYSSPSRDYNGAGVLDVTFHLSLNSFSFTNEKSFEKIDIVTQSFNGELRNPTLRLRPGDTLIVRLRNGNDLVDSSKWDAINRCNYTNDLLTTNLHFHGLHVSPLGDRGDNPFLTVRPGETNDYEIFIPLNHPRGTFWYHTHYPGDALKLALASNLVGALIIEGDLDGFSNNLETSQDVEEKSNDHAKKIQEEIFLFSTLRYDDRTQCTTALDLNEGPISEIPLLNGKVFSQTIPQVLSLQVGEIKRLRFVNANGNGHLMLKSSSGLTTRQLSSDGVIWDRVGNDKKDFFLHPGQRNDLLIHTDQPGIYYIFKHKTKFLEIVVQEKGESKMKRNDIGSDDDLEDDHHGNKDDDDDDDDDHDHEEEHEHQHFHHHDTNSNTESEDTENLPILFSAQLPAPFREILSEEVTTHKLMSIENSNTILDITAGRDNIPLETTIALNSIQEWTIYNKDTNHHPMHLHTNHMYLVKRHGQNVEVPRFYDTIEIESNSSITVRFRVLDFVGKIVMHCHNVYHPMMLILDIADVPINNGEQFGVYSPEKPPNSKESEDLDFVTSPMFIFGAAAFVLILVAISSSFYFLNRKPNWKDLRHDRHPQYSAVELQEGGSDEEESV
eukprot:Awhi_evm1s13291